MKCLIAESKAKFTLAECPQFPIHLVEARICHCPGYLGYAVTNNGRLFSCWQWGIRRKAGNRRFAQYWRECHGWIYKGYRYVDLSVIATGTKKKRRLHQLILEAFVGPRPDGFETRHLDGNPTNNNLTNLAYGTHRENQLDSIHHGTHAATNSWRAVGPPNQKLSDNDVRMIRCLRDYLRTSLIADLYDIHINTVYKIHSRQYRSNVT